MKGRVWGDLFRVEGATFVLNMFKFAIRFDEHIVFRIFTFSLLCGRSHLLKSRSVQFSLPLCADIRVTHFGMIFFSLLC